jgi:cytosine/adenosine deaminase-related metal-dependent hydrolase
MLVRGAAAILTGLPGTAARAAGPDVRVAGNAIAEVGRLAPAPGEEVLDAAGCVVYPGWVNTHHHLAESVLKGVPAGIDLPLAGWLEAVIYPYRRHYDAALLELAATIGMAELALSGCTTIADHHYLYWPGMPFDGDEVMFATAAKLGVRYVLCRGGATVAPPGNAPGLAPETLERIVAGVERAASRYHDPAPDAMTRVVVAPTAPTWSVRPAELRELARAGRALGLRLHTHLAETAGYVTYCREVHDTTPLGFAAKHGWIGPDVWFAHMVHLSPDEIRLAGETGTGVAHCAQSNCRLGSGIAPIRALADAGATVSIGVDGAASNESADMIAETHMAWLLQRARSGAGAATVEEVVHWGTRGGARVLGLDRVGGIAPGFAADLAVYALEEPRYAGLHDPAIGPVASGGRARLKWLLANGRVIVRDGAIPGLDLAALAARARTAIGRMVH